jgi:hypothetical protein
LKGDLGRQVIMWAFGSKFATVMAERLGVLEYKTPEGGFAIREYS